MSENSTDRIYTEALRNNYQGHALYPDIATTGLKPGSLGYFDVDGKWTLLCQLADNESVQSNQKSLIFVARAPTQVHLKLL
jgi:hypothetical protein